jgi:hypothetical protein
MKWFYFYSCHHMFISKLVHSKGMFNDCWTFIFKCIESWWFVCPIRHWRHVIWHCLQSMLKDKMCYVIDSKFTRNSWWSIIQIQRKILSTESTGLSIITKWVSLQCNFGTHDDPWHIYATEHSIFFHLSILRTVKEWSWKSFCKLKIDIKTHTN